MDLRRTENFDDVVRCYKDTSKSICIFEKFNEFFKKDLSPINKWLENQMNNKILKNISISTTYRKEGNVHFVRKDLKSSLEFYTKSLCFALPLSEEYGLALANRSAVTYEMGKYSDSLNDINLCLKTEYPNELKPKILIRKAECLQKLTNKETLLEYLTEVETFLKENSFKQQKIFYEKLEHLKNVAMVQKSEEHQTCSEYKLPQLEEGENPDFAYASAKIEMRFDSVRGRHVVAKERVLLGDVLFVEKAYAFSMIFDIETGNINQNKCYNCLKNVFSGIPCNSCVRCVFCNETCRDLSWKECHKWECTGMQTNMWYHLGVAFPALKVLFKAGDAIFSGKNKSPEEVQNFGSRTSNYPYFDSLIYHVRDGVIGTLTSSAALVRYLEEYTDFFGWLQTRNNCCDMDLPKMIKYIGGVLAKHILQLENNSSLIEHWVQETEFVLPNQKVSIACGIYPSVSIMNHSCKTNITTYFLGDTIVVKALENIEENSEILNCYGIDYRIMAREERQNLCLSLYNFKCNCIICSDGTKEMENFVAFKCLNGHDVLDKGSLDFCFCTKCSTKVDLKKLRRMNDNVCQMFRDENNEEALLKCLDFREKNLAQNHPDLQDVYQELYEFYREKRDFAKVVKYHAKWLKNEKCRVGGYSCKFARTLYEIGLIIYRHTSADSNGSQDRESLVEIARNMMQEGKHIASLHYPDYFIERMKYD